MTWRSWLQMIVEKIRMTYEHSMLSGFPLLCTIPAPKNVRPVTSARSVTEVPQRPHLSLNSIVSPPSPEEVLKSCPTLRLVLQLIGSGGLGSTCKSISEIVIGLAG